MNFFKKKKKKEMEAGFELRSEVLALSLKTRLLVIS